MGSGGGGGNGSSGSRPPRRSKQPPERFTGGVIPGGGVGGSGAGGGGLPAECQLVFETDLSGVDPEVLATIEVGDELTVVLHREGRYLSAVCRNGAGRIAGSLANIEDLATLISCLQGNHRYVAYVREVGEHNCTVLVEPRE